jgi:glycosyltransferase involved in cell wall biosynthesis
VGFVLFGDGPLRQELAAEVARAGLADRLAFAGFRNDFDDYLPHADLFVLPSFTEGLPNVVLEAFAAGVPVVATAVGGTPELVVDGRNGHLVTAGDPDELAGRISDVLADEVRRRRMGEHGREHVARHFTFAAQAEQYQELFDQVTSGPVWSARRRPGFRQNILGVR